MIVRWREAPSFFREEETRRWLQWTWPGSRLVIRGQVNKRSLLFGRVGFHVETAHESTNQTGLWLQLGRSHGCLFFFLMSQTQVNQLTCRSSKQRLWKWVYWLTEERCYFHRAVSRRDTRWQTLGGIRRPGVGGKRPFFIFFTNQTKKEENKVEGRVVEWEDASDTRRFWVQYHWVPKFQVGLCKEKRKKNFSGREDRIKKT